MIVGCYSMDLYCENEKRHERDWQFPAQFSGRNERECRRAARAKGWRLTRFEAYCPKCEAARKAKGKRA